MLVSFHCSKDCLEEKLIAMEKPFLSIVVSEKDDHSVGECSNFKKNLTIAQDLSR